MLELGGLGHWVYDMEKFKGKEEETGLMSGMAWSLGLPYCIGFELRV